MEWTDKRRDTFIITSFTLFLAGSLTLGSGVLEATNNIWGFFCPIVVVSFIYWKVLKRLPRRDDEERD